MAQLVIGAYTLEYPQKYDETILTDETVYQYLDGSVATDRVSRPERRKVVISWAALTQSQYDDVESALTALMSGPQSLTDPAGETWTAELAPTFTGLNTQNWTDAGAVDRYDCSMILILTGT